MHLHDLPEVAEFPAVLDSKGVLDMMHALGLEDFDRRTIDNMCFRKQLPFTKMGKKRRFRKQAVLDVMSELL